MAVKTLLLHEAIGETRAAALNAAGEAVGLFHDRWAERGERLRWGERVTGHIAKVSPGDGGAFIHLLDGREGFLATKDVAGLVQGARGAYRVAAEARGDKLAKLATAQSEDVSTPFECWRESLPCTGDLVTETGREAAGRIDEAFDEALSQTAPLPGGGRLQIVPTPALTAVDVDTIGRIDKGRASARAKAVNLAAAEALGRQMALRGTGGAVVLDCIAPLARRDGPEVKARFLTAFRESSGRRAECLAPSPFGLMEVVLEWRTQPLHEVYLDPAGEANALGLALAGLRAVEREASADRASSFVLCLPAAAFAAYTADDKIYEKALIERFGARIEVSVSRRDKIEVSAQ